MAGWPGIRLGQTMEVWCACGREREREVHNCANAPFNFNLNTSPVGDINGRLVYRLRVRKRLGHSKTDRQRYRQMFAARSIVVCVVVDAECDFTGTKRLAVDETAE